MPAFDLDYVGRMAMVTDPQGAPFYVMRGFSDETSHSFAFETPKLGHCAWNELSTTDPQAAFDFYGKAFGWTRDIDLDMGSMGSYSFIRHPGGTGGGRIGAIMPKMPQMPMPAWTHYFRVPDIDEAMAAIKVNGGTILQEPTEIPGGDFSMNALDPQGAAFALVGGRK